jgi:hypothetical protein
MFRVEYAHIYSNQEISKEHKTSIGILKKIKGDLQKSSLSSSLVVMVDDYSFPDPTFDYENFLSWLEEQGYKPDFLIRESQLISQCDRVYKMIEDVRLTKQIGNYIRSKKYPCSLFIATWYLVRLGKISSDLFPDELVASRLINILPKSFEPFEEQGLAIISATKFKGCINHIEYRYIEGRLIA